MGRLFWKFFFAILFAQFAAMLGVGAAFWVWDQARSEPQIDTGPGAEVILNAAEITLQHGGAAALRDLALRSGRERIFVIDGDGNDILGRDVSAILQAEAARLAGGAAVRELEAADGQRFTAFVQHGARGAPMLRLPPPEVFGAAPPRAMRGMHGKAPGPRLPYLTLVTGVLASLLFAALLAWYFARPIRALRAAFEAAAGGDLAPRFAGGARGRSDELADLGHDFDRMSGQLRQLIDNQRRLLHDVSHELRSPLARLQAAIGLAHQQPERLAASLERIERESVRMDKLIGELLTLARLDAGAGLPPPEPVTLLELVDEIAEDAAFEAAGQGRKVLVQGSSPAQVRAWPDLLWRAIENVVRNAIKHSAPGAPIEIALEEGAGTLRLQVRDRGPGVAAADLDHIFDPFYRASAASANVDGHGLGLAIARRVIEAHGGTIVAANRDGGGLTVTITLPVLA